MNILVDWGDADETLWIWRFMDNWTAKEFKRALAIAQAAIASKRHPVDVIVDIQRTGNLPKNLLSLLRTGIQPVYSHNGAVIVITRSRFWEKIHDLAVALFFHGQSTGIYFVRTTDEAYTLLSIIRRQRRKRGCSG